MKREKVYETENIVIYAKKPEVGEEANVADDCISAACTFAHKFAFHLKDPLKFLQAFREETEKEVGTLFK